MNAARRAPPPRVTNPNPVWGGAPGRDSLAHARERAHRVPGSEHAGLLGVVGGALLVGEVAAVDDDLIDVLVEPGVGEGGRRPSSRGAWRRGRPPRRPRRRSRAGASRTRAGSASGTCPSHGCSWSRRSRAWPPWARRRTSSRGCGTCPTGRRRRSGRTAGRRRGGRPAARPGCPARWRETSCSSRACPRTGGRPETARRS